MIKDGFYTHNDDRKRLLPSAMTERSRWCCFQVGDPNDRGKRNKRPCYENGQGADHTRELLTPYSKERVGYLFDVEDENAEYQQIFIDGDGLPDDPELATFYKQIYEELKEATYVEESISAELDGKFSFHAFGFAKLPVRSVDKGGKVKTARSNSRLNLELYDRARWCLTTGISPTYTKMSNIQKIINKIIAKMDELDAKVVKAKQVSKRQLQRRTQQLGKVSMQSSPITEEDFERVKFRLAWHRRPENQNLINQCGDYVAWQRVVYSLKSMVDADGKQRFSDSDIVAFCSNQPGFDGKAFNQILLGFKDADGPVQTANFFALSNDRGFPKGGDTLEARKKASTTKEPIAKADFYEFNPATMDTLVIPADLTEWFPPIGESNVICGKPGAGKSSLIMFAIAEATQKGHKVLVWSFDLRHEFLAQYLAAYGAKSEHVIIVDQPLSIGKIEDLIELKGITCFVPDPFLDFFGMASQFFMTNELTGKEQEFNPDQQWAWVKAFKWFRLWASEMKLSVLGTLHSAKGKFAHDLPHSGKLPAYLWKWWLLYRKGNNMQGFHERWLVDVLEHGRDDTRLLYQGKVRGSAELRHMTYNFGEEADESLLTPGVALRPKAITNIQFPKEDVDDDDGSGGYSPTPPEERDFPGQDYIREFMLAKHPKQWVTTSKVQEHFTERDEIGRNMVLGRLFSMARARRIECRETRTGNFSWRIGCLTPPTSANDDISGVFDLGGTK